MHETIRDRPVHEAHPTKTSVIPAQAGIQATTTSHLSRGNGCSTERGVSNPQQYADTNQPNNLGLIRPTADVRAPLDSDLRALRGEKFFLLICFTHQFRTLRLCVVQAPSHPLRTCVAGEIPRLTGARSAPYENLRALRGEKVLFVTTRKPPLRHRRAYRNTPLHRARIKFLDGVALPDKMHRRVTLC